MKDSNLYKHCHENISHVGSHLERERASLICTITSLYVKSFVLLLCNKLFILLRVKAKIYHTPKIIINTEIFCIKNPQFMKNI